MSAAFKASYRNKWSGATFVLIGPIEVHLRLGRSWVMEGENPDGDE